jgi:tricorn protease
MSSMSRFSVLAALSILAAIAAPSGASAQATLLLRQPTVSETAIAFAYANDLWVVPRSGGEARRLTVYPGQESDPHFSPDGRLIAFTAQYDGNTDVYVMPMAGGQPERLTWHPGPDLARGWTPDGRRVVFASGRIGAPVSYQRLWTVAVEGGMPEALPIPRAHAGSPSADGRRFAYQELPPPNNQWRNYRGGQTQPIRLINLNGFEVEKLPWDNSNDLAPVWMGNTVFFLSDRDLAINVYAYDTQASALKQLTQFTDYDVKSLDAGAGAVVFEQAGRIHLLDPATGRSAPLDIRVRGDFPWLRPHWEDVGRALTNPALSPTGARVAFQARGEIVTIPAEKGSFRNLTQSPGVADRTPSWAPDGKQVAWFSDESGEYRLMIGSQDGLTRPRAITLPEPSFYYTPAWSPDSKRLAFTDAKLNLWDVDVASGKVTPVDTDEYAHPERTVDPVWSPDSKWLAYTKRLDNQFHAVMVYSVDQARAFQLTDGMSDALAPAWDRSGKYLYFLASTKFALNVGWLDMSSYERPEERGIYLAVLTADEPSPLLPESDEEKPGEEPKKDEAKDSTRAVRIDLQGIDQRILALDVPLRNYVGIEAGLQGVVFYAESRPNQQGLVLQRYDLKKRKGEPFLESIQTAIVSADGKKLLYGAQGQWGIVSTDAGQKKVGDGKLDTAVRVRVDPAAEWKQMLREAWRYQRDYLYVRNFQGADWEEVWRRYEPWLPHVAHRSDFTYLLQNLAGELSIGHSYTFGGDLPDVDTVSVGLLGADVAVENGRYRITRILTGENWNPNLRAPLAGPGIRVAVGDYVLAVDGIEIPGAANFYRYFEGTAGRQVALTVNDRPTMDGARAITVVPVTSEAQLRQRAWVEANRRKVDQLSGGRLAYVWLPNTSTAGYDYFNRYYFAQQHKLGAVVDERFNGGGSAADYMVDYLRRGLTGFFNNPVGQKKPFRNPNAGIFGPKVMIINEAAGSGGDLLPFMFREMGIGPLVGTRTWGGLVGIWDVPPLMDGGSITAPRGGFYNLKGEWDVENVGVAPDVPVEQTAKDVAAERDPQLERAVQEALKLLETQQVEILAEPAPPVRAKRPAPR